MASQSPEGENPLWAYAVRTVQADTSGQDLKRLAVRLHHEALRQYLVLRLGDAQAAREALAEIAVQVDQWDTGRLTTPPGPRAHLFALARQRVKKSGTMLAAHASGIAFQNGTAAAEALRKLPEQHAEILELRHARELSPVEIAHVLEITPEQASARLGEAEAAAQSALSLSGGRALTLAAARTFALAPDDQAPPVEGAPEPLAPQTVVGERYTIEKAVGLGAFGQVYRASDNYVPGHTVALKLLHHPATSELKRQQALRELRLIASVFHPSVVSFKDHGWHQDRLWFVMPWYDGESLEDRMLREPLSRREALQIFVPLAHALASMHAAGVRHQDIKPENIFLAQLKTDPLGEDQQQPVLLDLGVAATDAESIVAGTPSYFAPEVAAHYVGQPTSAPISDKADVFSLALSLRNALEPSTMIEVQGSALQLFIAGRAMEPPDPPESKSLAFLKPRFERWLAVDPEARPTAAELATELSVLLEPEQRRERRRAFLGWFVPVTAAFLVMLAGGAFAWSENARKQERLAHEAQMDARLAQLNAAREAKLRKDLEASHGELKSEHARTTQVRDQLAAALEDTESQARALSGRARVLARARADTEKALEETEAQLQDVHAKAEELSSTKEQLEARLDESRLRNQELLEQSRELDALLEEARSLLQQEQSRALDLQVRLTETEVEREAEKRRGDTLRDQRDAANDRVEKLVDEVEELEAQRDRAREDLEKARTRNQKLQEQLRKARQGDDEEQGGPT